MGAYSGALYALTTRTPDCLLGEWMNRRLGQRRPAPEHEVEIGRGEQGDLFFGNGGRLRRAQCGATPGLRTITPRACDGGGVTRQKDLAPSSFRCMLSGVNPKRRWMLAIVAFGALACVVGLFFGSRDGPPPSLVIVGNRHEGGKEIVDFRVDVPWRRPAFLHPEGAKVLLQQPSWRRPAGHPASREILFPHTEQEPNWGSRRPAFQRNFTNSSATFEVVAPAGSSVWKLRLTLWVEHTSIRRRLNWMAGYWQGNRKIHWPYQVTTPYSLESDFITNAVPKTADALRP